MTREQYISLVKSTQEAFRRFLVALCCGDTTLADDIAQDSYVKAYLSCDSLKNTDKFKNWLFRIGYNSYLNKKRAEHVFEAPEEACYVLSETETDSKFRYQALYQALARLSKKERIAILLFYMQGYSAREIADMMATSQDAVRQYLLRGRMHLHALLTSKNQ